MPAVRRSPNATVPESPKKERRVEIQGAVKKGGRKKGVVRGRKRQRGFEKNQTGRGRGWKRRGGGGGSAREGPSTFCTALKVHNDPAR